MSKLQFGRSVIYTDVLDVTPGNVLNVLEKALETHRKNRNDIQYLYSYYKGNQPILNRKKAVRPEINNKVVINRANEIVTFKVGYLIGEPVQYVNRGGDELTESINTLNEYMFMESKATKDKELAEWFTICGVGYRMVLPNAADNEDESPFKIYTLDPRDTFVVRYNGLGNNIVMGVKYVTTADNRTIYSIYTDKYYFEVVDGKLTKADVHYLGAVPIIEYPFNTARIGAFEAVISLLDAINITISNRLDGVEQFIQALLVFKGITIDSEEYKELKEEGGIEIPTESDIKYLTQELNQTQTQTLVDDMYQTVLTICGMPNRNGGSSTSDTGNAVIMRDGWSSAEARAKDTETVFKEYETEFLRQAIYISNTLRGLNLKASAVEPKFTRRNYENIQTKSQVLATMLANDKIHPRLAFAHSGMFADPEAAYLMSKKHYDEKKQEAEKELAAFTQNQVNQSKAAVEDV